MDLVVDTTELRRFATGVLGGNTGGGGVIDYLSERHGLLREIAIEAEQGHLEGGWGKTGAFHEALLRFAQAFGVKLMDFTNEEGEFIQFLSGLRDRMIESAGTYEEVESQNVQSFGSITSKLNPE